MNLAFSRFTARLGTRSLSLLLPFGLMLVPPAVMGQTQSTYTNLGIIVYLGPGASGNTVPFPPQIDATNFVNRGTMEISTLPSVFPFMTSHTLNFTNTGEMLEEVGWEFDYGPLPSGGRGMAANFYNGNYNPSTGGGLIESFSAALPNPFTVILFSYDQGYLWVSATNIVNKGVLEADAASEIKLAGTNVDLSRSYVQIESITGTGSINNVPTNAYTPDTAIYDEYWAQTNRPDLDSGAIWDGTTAILPPHVPFPVAEPCGAAGNAMLAFSPAVADSTNYAVGFLLLTVTNQQGTPSQVLVATNIIYQAAFVNITDPNITGTIGFTPSAIPTNNFQTVSVELRTAFGDTLFLVDTLASDPGRGLLANSVIDPANPCSAATFRPTNYIVERIPPAGGIGVPGAGVPPANFFYNPTNYYFPTNSSNLSYYTGWSNRAVAADYAAYSCFVDNEASEPPSNPGGGNANASSVTNLPGRVHINAGSLNLYNTQMRGEGEIVIQASHLVSSQNAIVDCENLSYNLGSTNGNLNVANLAPLSVVRFNGTVSECSAVWSNVTFVVTTNYVTGMDTNGVTTNAPAFLTNSVQIGVYALLVDAGNLASEAPVTVYDLLLHSTNMVITDSMNVVESFLLDGTNFTLNGNLTFPGTSPVDPISGRPFVLYPIQNWVYTMAPTLLFFINNGSLSIPSDAHFGDDGPTNYLVFLNSGIITAGAQTIDSVNLQISNGVNQATISDFSATAGTAIISNAVITAAGDIDFYAGTLLIDDSSVLAANYALNFTVTNNLSDGGTNSGNQFSCQNGFNLWIKPQTGDLLGTTIASTAWLDAEVDHFWAGEDRGSNAAGSYAGGFTNNEALGMLVLSPQEFAAPYYPLFFFSGTGVSNGLYVVTLDVTQLGANITNMLAIDPSLTIYYAHALVDTNAIHLGTNTPPERYLDGLQFPPGTGGYLRYVQDYTGHVVAAPSPPPNGKLSASYLKSGGPVQFTLSGAAGRTYVVQASTDMINWVPILTNSTPASGLLQFIDSKATNYPARFYRTVLVP